MVTLIMLFLPLLIVLTAVNSQESQCPTDILHVAGTCYVFKNSTTKKWSKAVSNCINNYEQIAKPPTNQVNNAVKERLKDYNPECKIDNSHRYWFGLTITDTKEYYHFDKTSTNVTYFDWNPYKETPAGEYGSKNCVAYECQNNMYWWANDSCNLDLPFICEMTECPDECIPEDTTAPPTTTAQGTTVTTSNETATANAATVTDGTTTAGGTSNGDQQKTTQKSASTAASAGKATSILTTLTTLRFLLLTFAA